MAHFVQQYTTTVDAIKSRLEAGKLKYAEVQLKGVTMKVRDASDFDVYDGNQTVYVRENRHYYESEAMEGAGARTVTIHRERSDDPDGTI
jgi:hypothetical protein